MKPRRRFRIPNPLGFRRAVTSLDYIRPQRWNWTVLVNPLDSRLHTASGGVLDRTHVRSLSYFWLDGLFSTMGENFFIGFVVLFALAYGATSSQVGFITAAGNLLGAIALYPGAVLGRNRKSRKKLVLLSGGGLSRFSILLLAAVPFLTRNPFTAILLITLLNASKAFWGNLGNPAWTAIVADIVPDTFRGRYFTSRNFAMGAAALISAPAAGKLIRSVNQSLSSATAGYQAVFTAAFVLGMLGTLFFSMIQEEHPGSSDLTGPRIIPSFRNAGFRPLFFWFLASSFIWSMSVQISAPFFTVYMVQNLGADPSYVGYAAGISSLAALGGQLVFGRILNRRGDLRVQLISGFLIPLIPILWLFFTRPWHAFYASLLGGFLWAGYNLTNFNLLLRLTPEEKRPQYVAAYQAAIFLSAVLGPLAGGILIHVFGYRSIFIFSTIGRLAGIVLFAATVGAVMGRNKEPV
jgi:MFS family permease